ncbi:hypothetical protein ACFWVT_21570 [Streptomyces cyaneofuscatus]|uniref:hypothetical protein n=1 Tax=Streptomyces cyaneofuscatus TaxID=66883 RepID=UPI0036491087
MTPAELPGSRTVAASWRSPSSSRPEEAPSNKARSSSPTIHVGERERSDRTVLGLAGEGQVENADDTPLDEVEQQGQAFPCHAIARKIQDQVVDRTHPGEFVDAHSDSS